jgi:hypothetical protein
MLATASGVPWTYVVIPWATLLLTAGLACAAFYPQMKDRRDTREQRAQLQEFQLAAAEAVLGRDADPRRGRPKVVGLVEVTAFHGEQLTTISRTIGSTNGTGKTVMDHVHDAAATAERIGAGQSDLADRFDAHEEQDMIRFSAVESKLSALAAAIGRPQ